MTTAQKPRTLTRQVSQLGEVRFDGAVWVDAIYGSPGGLGHVLSQKITVRVDGPDAIPAACTLGDPHTMLCQLDRAGGPPRDAAELLPPSAAQRALAVAGTRLYRPGWFVHTRNELSRRRRRDDLLGEVVVLAVAGPVLWVSWPEVAEAVPHYAGEVWHIISPLGTSVHEHPLLAPILSEATRAALAADVASRAISMPMRREIRRLIETEVQAWARRARITEDAPPAVVEG